jgi:hypothetical protein
MIQLGKKEAATQLAIKAIFNGFRGIDTACQPKHYRLMNFKQNSQVSMEKINPNLGSSLEKKLFFFYSLVSHCIV